MPKSKQQRLKYSDFQSLIRVRGSRPQMLMPSLFRLHVYDASFLSDVWCLELTPRICCDNLKSISVCSIVVPFIISNSMRKSSPDCGGGGVGMVIVICLIMWIILWPIHLFCEPSGHPNPIFGDWACTLKQPGKKYVVPASKAQFIMEFRSLWVLLLMLADA